jgi:hypothetical protein
MVVVAIIALDLGLLLNRGFGANPFQVLTVAVIEVGLFRAFSRSGGHRVWWLGFTTCGLAYVVVDAVYHYEIRYAIIDFCQLSVVKPSALALLIAVPLPEPVVFGLLAALLQVVAAILFGVGGGSIAQKLTRRSAGTANLVASDEMAHPGCPT